MPVRLSLLALVCLLLLAGCAGQSCDGLPALREERDAARAAYLELTAPGTAAGDVTERADAAVHELDRRVFELEQACDAR